MRIQQNDFYICINIVYGVYYILYKYNVILCIFMFFRGFDKWINSELVYFLIYLYIFKDCEIKVYNVVLLLIVLLFVVEV